ncbi:membrane-bound PQQ-dependent dehydrogenase, glucose/quinate/shikimate family [Acinetobacter pittii]|uniref:membrane-bound PQQ-dependent dehydrogenase, glucose/quinate/shikimate family n=1 Tax=Acinetobacter pittii TaxID=48296 RepID=UPI003008DFC7
MKDAPTNMHIFFIKTYALLQMIFALILYCGGAYLIYLNGSSYYLITGLLLLVSSFYLFRNKLLGAKIFAGVFIYTLIWTMWEVGDRYWGWIPRVATIAIFTLFLTLLLPYIEQGVSKRISRILTGLVILCFIMAGALAWFPHYSTFDQNQIPNTALAQYHSDNQQPTDDWRYYGRDAQGTRFSPTNQITPENINQLKQVWVTRTGDMPPVDKKNKWAAQTTPIKVNDSLYLCTATNNMLKLDARTGKKIWEYKHNLAYEKLPSTAVCRGVTFYTSKVIPESEICHEKVIEGTLDMQLIAVDAKTGKACPQFGTNGHVNLLEGIGHTVPGFMAVTSPPPVVNGVIVVNHKVQDNQRRTAPSGVIRAYDVDTGSLKWAWDVRQPNRHGLPPKGETYSRGTPNSWTVMTVDEKLNTVYVPTGSSAPDYYSALRTEEENQISTAVVALDAQTGVKKWSFQTVHKDAWDYDLGSQATLLDYKDQSGQIVPALIMPTKRGQTFVLNRITGKPISKVVERQAPESVIPDDVRSPTQPWSVDIPRLGFSDLTESKMWGISPIDQMLCRIKYRQAYYVGEFTPPTVNKPWIQYPGFNGGSDWGSIAYNPKNGILIANWSNTPMYNQLVARAKADQEGILPMDDPKFSAKKNGSIAAMAESPYAVNVQPFYAPITNVLCNEPPYGMVTAINMNTKKVIWQKPLGTAEHNGPFGLPTYLPINIGTPNNGGPIITDGGVVFVAAATDNRLHAFDSKTGKSIWSAKLPAGGQATPMTYSIDGEQYVVIVAGGHYFMQTPPGDYVVAFKLMKK